MIFGLWNIYFQNHRLAKFGIEIVVNNMKLLSIVIPTYNRCTDLLNTLENLKFQIGNLISDDIEIIISDNASSDQTTDLVNSWLKENKEIDTLYFKNHENQGFDKNCLIGASKASGRFIWFMSDDDLLVEHAISNVLEALHSNHDVVFAFVNYSMLTPGFDEYFPCKFKKNIRLSADDLLIRTRLGFSFITACIFNREIFCGLKLNGYVGSGWIHVHAVKEVALKGLSLIIADPLIKMRRPSLEDSRRERKDPNRKIDIFMECHLSFLFFLKSLQKYNYSSNTANSLMQLGWADNLNQIISLKLTSEKYRREELILIFFEMKKFFNSKVIFWIIHVPLLFSPKVFAEFYFYLKLKYIGFKKIIKSFLISIKFINP